MTAAPLVNNVWLVVGVWVIVYLCDYYGTIYGARLYREDIRRHISFEGSYELNPVFRRDIDALRRVSLRFVLLLVLSSLVLVVAWNLGQEEESFQWLFQLAAGALILRGMAVDIRHTRNIAMFRMVARSGGIEGKIRQARWLVLKLSAIDLLCFAALFAVLAPLGPAVFFLGGTFACCITAGQNWIGARRGQARTREEQSIPR